MEIVKLIEQTAAAQASVQDADVASKARAVTEVQAATVMALQRPRDTEAATQAVLAACKRPTLAERAVYEFPRGGQLITGPSIHLVREIARHWKNIRTGLVEIHREHNASLIEAYAWDIESNIYDARRFWVKHERRRGRDIYPLDDPRDIYEQIASQGARYLRACLLSVLPSDLVEAAMEECDRTLVESMKGKLDEARERMIKAFEEIGVHEQALHKYLGFPPWRATARQVARLRRIYTAIKDGILRPGDVFDMSAPPIEQAPPKPKRGRPPKQQPTQAEEPPADVEIVEPEKQPDAGDDILV